ncbi:MAG: hypothetical protein L3K01_02710 [Thermoplasmata archaeon]|nr:hypothetical protein [Thermoplasmata archaeon]MCI4332631.1 hypothetical protein [Thermoplasmata archaeon]
MRSDPDPLAVALPRPVDRKLHLGPFPSARDALKFAGYASVGVVAIPFAGPGAVVPFALAGFLFAVHRREGRAFDDRFAGYLAWQWRRRVRTPRGAGSASPAVPGRSARVGGGRIAAVVRTGGVPVAFLPTSDAVTLFEGTRRWLEGLDGSVYVVADAEPVRPGPFLPRGPGSTGTPEAVARAGYDSVVRLLLRRRRIRRVALVLWEGADRVGAARLDSRVAATEEALRRLGVETERLEGRALFGELRRLGLVTGEVG